jgi:hypothetical protein
MNAKWTSDDVPGQQGRLAVVTGANTGLGVQGRGCVVREFSHDASIPAARGVTVSES